MKIRCKQNSTVWEEEVFSIDDIKNELEANPQNEEYTSFEIIDEKNENTIIHEGKYYHECIVDEDDEFWFDIDESQSETIDFIEESVEKYFSTTSKAYR